MQALSIGSPVVWHVVQELLFDRAAIVVESKLLACGFESGCGSYIVGFLRYAKTPTAPTMMIAHTNRAVRHGLLRSRVGRQLNIALPGFGFSVGRRRLPQSSFSRERFSQNTRKTSAAWLGAGVDGLSLRPSGRTAMPNRCIESVIPFSLSMAISMTNGPIWIVSPLA